jgi:hypothetical protein
LKPLLLAVAVVLMLVTMQWTRAQDKQEPQLKHLTASPANFVRPAFLTALSIERGVEYPSLVRLKGSVEIKTPVCLPVGNNSALVCDGEMIIRADAAEFDEGTGEIEAHGHVHITPLRHRGN